MDNVPIADDAGALVLAACEGEGAVADLVGGTTIKASAKRCGTAAAMEAVTGVFLKSISVEGFRGIGPARTLMLQPGPGLTLGVGRNGSGKSSFAEALELLLTGSNQCWADRSMAWRDDWQNLHHRARTAIQADFTIEGHGPTVVAREWRSGQKVTAGEATAQHKGEPRAAFSRLGWEIGLALYRPFPPTTSLGRSSTRDRRSCSTPSRGCSASTTSSQSPSGSTVHGSGSLRNR